MLLYMSPPIPSLRVQNHQLKVVSLLKGRISLITPQYLEKYLIDDSFKCNKIFDGPSTLTCKGVGEQRHIFLKFATIAKMLGVVIAED